MSVGVTIRCNGGWRRSSGSNVSSKRFAKQIENLRCSGPVFAKCNRITSRNLEADFFEALDQHTPRPTVQVKKRIGRTETAEHQLANTGRD
ncbi:hypothetical protein CgunFtcFv8_000742 [Champsocephalus gunnari]|uniref:Uncharacterized protein n=1 Tax=Champsocephalus gunnari TaxID=52237 RepID=A0AAN8DJ63_CHAGU|nr:hypothetical protein CgunFtcFv8_000742 [Champsocephalus gunnari]